MARKRKRKKNTREREYQKYRIPDKVLPVLNDRRRFIPERDVVLYDDGGIAKYEIRGDDRGNRADRTLGKISFVNPKKVAVCRRRSQRKKALFQKGKIGKGKSTKNFKERVMKDTSDIKC